MENAGIGPARITGMRVDLDGTAYSSWAAVLAAVQGPDTTLSYDTIGANDMNGKVLSAGAETTILRLPWTEETRTLLPAFQRLQITLCYCSVFDQCWISRLGAATQEAACAIPETEQFEG